METRHIIEILQSYGSSCAIICTRILDDNQKDKKVKYKLKNVFFLRGIRRCPILDHIMNKDTREERQIKGL